MFSSRPRVRRPRRGRRPGLTDAVEEARVGDRRAARVGQRGGGGARQLRRVAVRRRAQRAQQALPQLQPHTRALLWNKYTAFSKAVVLDLRFADHCWSLETPEVIRERGLWSCESHEAITNYFYLEVTKHSICVPKTVCGQWQNIDFNK